jgi:hypothetical protein
MEKGPPLWIGVRITAIWRTMQLELAGEVGRRDVDCVWNDQVSDEKWQFSDSL